MIVAIMQPYFFPYIGYFQLMDAADIFVFYDDVQYMKGGWVNRNRIRSNGRSIWLTMPVIRASMNERINKRLFDVDKVEMLSARFRGCYSEFSGRAEFSDVVCLLDSIGSNVAASNAAQLTRIRDLLGIECRTVSSSELDVSGSAGQARVIQICKRMGATTYINPIGGVSLYEADVFEREGIDLRFVRTKVPPVELIDECGHLSIIDSLVVNGREGCQAQLPDYEVLSPEEAGGCP